LQKEDFPVQDLHERIIALRAKHGASEFLTRVLDQLYEDGQLGVMLDKLDKLDKLEAQDA
jgi:arginine repressor